MTRVARVVLAAFLSCAAAAPTVSAQRTPELSLAGGWLSPTGGDFADTEAGLGGDLTLRVPVASRVTLGGGVHWSRHAVDFTEDSYDILAVFAEPRMLLGEGDGAVRPFVAARLAFVREAITVGAQDRSAGGVGVGFLVGVVAPLSDAVDVEAAAGGYHLAFGDFRADGASLGIDGGSGRALALRLALNVRP